MRPVVLKNDEMIVGNIEFNQSNNKVISNLIPQVSKDTEIKSFDVSRASEGYFGTYSGGRIHLIEPLPEEVDLVDIAHQLSLICRWNGALKCHYSVAQHCVHVSEICDPKDALKGLLHDASEAYTGDITRPLKYLPAVYPVFKKIEKNLDNAIAKKFGLDSLEKTPSIEIADVVQLSLENIYLKMKPSQWAYDTLNKYPQFKNLKPLKPWRPEVAERNYLKRFTELIGK